MYLCFDGFQPCIHQVGSVTSNRSVPLFHTSHFAGDTILTPFVLDFRLWIPTWPTSKSFRPLQMRFDTCPFASLASAGLVMTSLPLGRTIISSNHTIDAFKIAQKWLGHCGLKGLETSGSCWLSPSSATSGLIANQSTTLINNEGNCNGYLATA